MAQPNYLSSLDPEEEAYYVAEQERQWALELAGHGWDWEARWGAQPCDEHCRARLRLTSLGPLHSSALAESRPRVGTAA